MPYTVTCDICKDTKAIEEYGGRLLIWDWRTFDAMYAAKLCNYCEEKLITLLRMTKSTKEHMNLTDYFGLTAK